MEKRIWNEQELKSMPEFYIDARVPNMWSYKDDNNFGIPFNWIGKTVKEIELSGRGNIVKDWMIANTEEEKVISDDELRVKPKFQLLDGGILFNGKTYIEKPQPKTVTLDNGTVLEVGKKYQNNDEMPFEIITIGKGVLFVKDEENIEGCENYSKRSKIFPYTEQPAEQPKEWKTFLIEKRNINDKYDYQVIARFMSEEDARTEYPRAKSITEVKVNIEEVNN